MANPEKDVLNVIYNCGGITKKGILTVAGSEEVLKELMGKKMLKKQPIEVNDRRIALYTFTDAGEHYFTELTGKKHFYRCSRNEKVVALSYFYISENPERDSWKNKDEWYADGEEGVIPDGTYIKDGQKYGVVIMRKTEKERVSGKLKEFSQNNDLVQIKVMVQ